MSLEYRRVQVLKHFCFNYSYHFQPFLLDKIFVATLILEVQS